MTHIRAITKLSLLVKNTILTFLYKHPSRHLVLQSQQLKRQSNESNLFIKTLENVIDAFLFLTLKRLYTLYWYFRCSKLPAGIMKEVSLRLSFSLVFQVFKNKFSIYGRCIAESIDISRQQQQLKMTLFIKLQN